MRVTFDDTEYEFDPRRLGSLELIGLKKSAGYENRMQFFGALFTEDIEAVVALRWIFARRDSAGLKYSDAPPFDSYDLVIEDSDKQFLRSHMSAMDIRRLDADEREYLGITGPEDVGGGPGEANAGATPGTSTPSPKQVFGPGKSDS